MSDNKIDLRAMEQQVEELGARLAALRQRLKTGTDRMQEQLDQLRALEARHRELGDTIARYHREGTAAERDPAMPRQASDLDAAVRKFTDWVDAEEHSAPPPGGFSP